MKTIIDMAREAGFVEYELEDYTQSGYDIRYGRFAALVRAEAQAEEREACAKVCEELGMATNGMYERNHECAAAIRAKGGE